MQLMAELVNTFYSRIFPTHTMIEDENTGELVCSCGNPNCSTPGKHPKVKWLDWQFDGNMKHFNEANVAIRTGYCEGDDDNLLVLDVDLGQLIPRPDTYTIQTSLQENGRWREQFYFKSKNTYKGSTGIEHPCGARIDIRSHNNYVIGAGSKHKSGTIYSVINNADIVELTPELEAFLKPYLKQESYEVFHVDISSKECSFTSEIASELLSKIKLETISKKLPDDYDTWLRVSVASQRANVPFEAWLAWCKREPGYENDSNAEMLAKWKSFKGYKLRPITHKTFWNYYCTCTIDEEILQNVIEVSFKKEEKKAYFDKTKLPSIMQDFMQFVHDKTQYVSERSELAAALSLLSTITMHGYRSPTGTPLSLYILLANNAGTSKSSAKNVVHHAVRDIYAKSSINWNAMNIGKIQSRQALQARLIESPYRACISDEFIQSMKTAFADSEKEINSDRISALLTCFDGEYLEASETKTKENTLAAVENPILTILGCGTTAVFEKLASTDAFKETGFASRCLLFNDRNSIINEDFNYDMYLEKYKNINDLVNICKRPKKKTDENPELPFWTSYETITVLWQDNSAKMRFADIDMNKRREVVASKEMPDYFKEFLGRHGNKVVRISTLLALADGRHSVSMNDLDLAEEIVNVSNEDMFEHLKYSTAQEKLEERIVHHHAILVAKLKRIPKPRELMHAVSTKYFKDGGTQKLISLCTSLELGLEAKKTVSIKAKG
jgi:hypothetical protein